jgi:hypothetical protein
MSALPMPFDTAIAEEDCILSGALHRPQQIPAVQV